MPSGESGVARPAHVLVAISAHGLGHLAQTAPVVEALARRRPELKLTILSGLSREIVARRIRVPFDYIQTPDDFGLVMASSFTVDAEETARRYREMHAGLGARVAELAAQFQALQVDAVLSNVGYLPLAAAAHTGVPGMAFSSITWRDVLAHYCKDSPGIAEVLAQIAAIYDEFDFLRLEPGLEMTGIRTILVDRIIVSTGQNRRAELLERFGLSEATRIVSFSFSESETAPQPRFDPAELAGEPVPLLLIGPNRWAGDGVFLGFEEVGLPFIDLVWSSDLIVAKPGYGIATELSLAGTPAIFLPREDWPETGSTLNWNREHLRLREIECRLSELKLSDLVSAAEDLKPLYPLKASHPGGEETVVDAFLAKLG